MSAIWYNSFCHTKQNTRALCFPKAASLSQSDIVGKVPSINGDHVSLAVSCDNGSAICEGHFAMGKIKNLAGQKFDRLTVIKFVEIRDHSSYWLCQCDCGNLKVIRGDCLSHAAIRNKTKSCGCLKRERNVAAFSMPNGDAARRKAVLAIKVSAIRRGYEWKLSNEIAIDLLRQNCFYCGAEPQSVRQSGIYTGKFICNGIDRVDNSKGYLPDNVVPCCKHCNRAKRTRSVEEFLGWVEQVYKHSILEKGKV